MRELVISRMYWIHVIHRNVNLNEAYALCTLLPSFLYIHTIQGYTTIQIIGSGCRLGSNQRKSFPVTFSHIYVIYFILRIGEV